MILVLGIFMLASCGGDTETGTTPPTESEAPTESQPESDTESDTQPQTPTTTTYTVTVVDTDGNAIPMVALKIGTKSAVTNAQGQASATLDTGVYTVTIVMASGYKLDTKTFTFVEGEDALTIVLEREGGNEELVTYTVKVVDENGNGISGVALQLCQGACNRLPNTDENGVSTIKLAAKEYNLQILTAEGYIVPEGYIATLPLGQTEITVTLNSLS